MANVAELTALGMASDVLDAVRAVANAAEEQRVAPYLVGGLVRDLVIGEPIQEYPDVDVTLVGADSKTFDEIARRVSGEITKRSQFNTVAMKVGKLDFDLTMARSERYPSPGSLPVVRQGTLEEDLARRDFSVNAMAVSLSHETWGELHDPQGGLEDLRKGRLRALYADSFRDDATRILRAARYSSRLSLTVTDESLSALKESVGATSFISPARVRDEMERVFLEKNAAVALALLDSWAALAAIHPALEYNETAWTLFTEEFAAHTERERIATGYAILGCGLSKKEAAEVAARLRPGALGRRALLESASLSERFFGGTVVRLSNSGLAAIMDPLSEHSVMGCALVMAGSQVGNRLDEYLRCYRHVRAELSGHDIIRLGVAQGPEVGTILRRLRAARQDGLVTSREEEEAFVLDSLKSSRNS